MSSPTIRHHEPEAWPTLQPATLGSELSNRLTGEPPVNLPLWQALLTLAQGKALGVSCGPGQPIDLLWGEADAGFRDGISEDWAPVFEEVRRQGNTRIDSIEAPGPMTRLTFALPNSPLVCGCLFPEQSAEQLSRKLTLIQASAGFLIADKAKQSLNTQQALLRHTAAWVDLCTHTLETRTFDEAALRLSEKLREHLGLETVVVADVTPRNTVHLHAITGQLEIDRRGRLSELIQTVISEHRKTPEPVHVDPETPLDSSPVRELLKQLQISGLSILPLGKADPAPPRRFVLLFLGHAVQQEFLSALGSPLEALLRHQFRTRPRGIRKWVPKLFGDYTRLKGAAVLIFAVGVIGFLIQPTPYRLRIQGQIEPASRRLIAAQTPGLLEFSTIQPGQRVSAGETLATLEDLELRLREAELMATRDRRIKRRDDLAGTIGVDVAERQIAELELAETERQLELLNLKRSQLHLRAPIDGIVLAGDLSRRIGASIDAGELLFELAPLDRMRVELHVPSRQIAWVEKGMPVHFRVETLPEQEWTSEITRVHARSQSDLPENPFIIEVPFPGTPPEELRPGMRARAVLLGPTRPRLFHLLQPWIDRIRLTFFR